ncbi:MAG: rod shape-determining protein MreD [Thermoanaerobaculia bacterium]|nr:rod shape-determining protein MreD [Thermoanaerobaculia bacterium]
MLQLVRFVVALAIAAAIQVLGLEIHGGFARVADPFLIVAVFVSLPGRPVAAMFAGSATGLACDALAGGSFGLHGFANTLTAYLSARLGQRLMAQQPFQVMLLFMLAGVFQQALVTLAGFLLVADSELPELWEVLARMVSTGLGGLALALVARRFSSWLQNRNDARRGKLSMAR